MIFGIYLCIYYIYYLNILFKIELFGVSRIPGNCRFWDIAGMRYFFYIGEGMCVCGLVKYCCW